MKKLRLSKLLVLLVSICLMSTINSYALTTEEILDTTEVSVRLVYTDEYRRELAKEGIFIGNSEIGFKIPASYFKDYEDNIVYRISNNGNVSARWKSVGIVKLRDVLPNSTEEEFIEAISQSNIDKKRALSLITGTLLASSILIVMAIVMQNRVCTEIGNSESKGDQCS